MVLKNRWFYWIVLYDQATVYRCAHRESKYWNILLMSVERSDSIRSATSSDLDKIQFSPRLSESSDSVITGKKNKFFFLGNHSSFSSDNSEEPRTKSPSNSDENYQREINPSRGCSKGCLDCNCCCCRLFSIRWEFTSSK